MLKKNFLLGAGITNENENKILEYLLLALKRDEKFYIVTPNPEILVYANDHPEYKKILNGARIALPDGVGVFLGCALMSNTLKERITGVDFMEEICKRCEREPITVGFLGGRHGVAELTAECLKNRYPWLDVVFAAEEWDFKISNLKSPANPAGRQISNPKFKSKNLRVKNSNAFHEPRAIDILFVAFGHPKQELWIAENLDRLPVKAAMGVGGAFDYVSGRVERAPFMIRAIGFEWLYRLIKQPWRWRRQLALGKFVWLVLKERLGSRLN